MKFKPGTKVVIVNVPARAVAFGVQPGMPATIQDIEETPAVKDYLDSIGMTHIHLDVPGLGWCFWWLESDLALRQ